MDELSTIINILEESVKKNGEKPLTNKWLLNILRLADKRKDEQDDLCDATEIDIY